MSNVSNEELDKFNQIASQWWDANGPMKPLHQLNPLRLAFIQQHVDLANSQVLDIGCGAGLLSEAMSKQGAKVTGVDAASEVIAAAKTHAEALDPAMRPTYVNTTIEAFNDSGAEQFDVITCMELLEHVPNPEQFISDCIKRLKPGGKVFFSTINRNLKAYGFAILGAEYLLRKLPIGTHKYDQFIKPSELNHWAIAAELNLLDLAGLTYHPLKDQFSLSKNTDINYLACYQK